MACETVAWLEAKMIILERVILVAEDESMSEEERVTVCEMLNRAEEYLGNRRPALG